jgi:hypothetical protein
MQAALDCAEAPYAIDAIRSVMSGAKKIRRSRYVLQGKVKEQRSTSLPVSQTFENRSVICSATLHGVIKDCGVGRQPRDRKIIDVVLEGTVIQ